VQHGLGPVVPWSAEAEVRGCRWRAETSWDAAEHRWAVWIGCEGGSVGACHLDDAAWSAGACRLVDPAELLEPVVRRALEAGLDAAFFASVTAAVEQPILAYLDERRWSGLAAKLRGADRLAREHVTRLIDHAFAGAAMPASAEELTTRGIHGPYVVEHFLHKDRDEVAAGFMPSLHMEDFTYMTRGAVAYYLPVVLRLMMTPPYDADLWIYLRAFLRPRRAEALAKRLGGFDAAQLAAIGGWARHLHLVWLWVSPSFIDPAEASELALAYGATGRNGV
jgi:hypothetical protein